MSWIDKYKTYWRTALLVLCLLAFIGPWGFDLLYVTEEFMEEACPPPIIRLERGYCGYPVPGTAFVDLLASELVPLLTGGIDLTYGILPFTSYLFACLILLPFITTLLLIPGRESRRRHVSRVVVWALAAGASLLWVTLNALRIGGFSWKTLLPWKLWGIWIYIGLAGIALVMERLAWRRGSEMGEGA